MFGNFSFFNTINAYINKNLALLWLSRRYLKTGPDEEIFSKTFYQDKKGEKKALAPAAFFNVNENVVEAETRFQIPNPHFCTNAALARGADEADLLLPFFNSKKIGERAALLIQKEVLYLEKEKINVFVEQGEDEEQGVVSYYSLFMFLVNLYCFEEAPLLEVRKAFEAFLVTKDFPELFGYFVIAFKAKLAEIKPFFKALYAENYVDCNYSETIVNSNKKIALQVKLNYSNKVSLAYQMKLPASRGFAAGARAVPIEFLLTLASGKEVFEAGINNLVPYAIKFAKGKAAPEFKYAKRFSDGSDMDERWTDRGYIEAFGRKLPYALEYKRRRIQTAFIKNLNSRAFANQIKDYGNMTEIFVKNNIAAIQARKFIVEISGDLLKNVLLIASLS